METELKNHIAAIVRAARKAKGITQEELAGRIKRTPESLSNVERGNTLPSIETLVCLCQELEINPNSIFQSRSTSKTRTANEQRLAQEIQQMIERLDEDALILAKAQIAALLEFTQKSK
ncbi:helix-turn-helix domain-containing protein [Hirschia maritima]|uniref:helix-turn-helix domain-containing protein n=1 Tax=Hirschia maritima TaxID=1121961 RepID=UPI000375F424|nr:helix-turn-helix transcriptional regulator [Hirschia maritima]